MTEETSETPTPPDESEGAEPAEASAEEAAEPAPPSPEETIAKLKDQLLRTAADFDNFRKRSRRDVEDAARRAREQTVLELLPLVDNLERAVDAADKATDVDAVLSGVRMVLRSFSDIGARMQLQRVAAVGEPFDPSVHDAVQQVETADHDPGTIVAEVTPGYRLGEKLLRAALVVVARPPAESEGE
ncbi:MAG: nucleotide exchange factor GrpE [Myxococcota bacterium]